MAKVISFLRSIYEYKKLKPISFEELITTVSDTHESGRFRVVIYTLVNKINETTIEYNHLAKDLELYKKAYKQHSHTFQGTPSV